MPVAAYHGRITNAPGGRPRAVSSSAPTSNAPPATLASARLPRRTRQALEHLLADLRPVLEQQLPQLLHETELALARTAASNDPLLEQARLASMRSLGGGGPAFVRSFLANIEASLAGLQSARRDADAPGTPPVLTLSLLEEDAVSDEFVLDTMASRIEARNSLGLQLLGQRFGVLAGAPAFDGDTLPLGPRALCDALAQSTDLLDLSRYARMQLFQHFEKALMDTYPALLEGFNNRLIEDGILPFLSFVPMRVRVRAGSASTAFDAAGPGAGPGQSGGGAAAGWPAPEEAAPPSVAAGFAALQSLLQQRRSLLSKLRPGSRDERVLDSMPHDEVLATLQRMRTSTGKADTLADFRRILLAQARQAHGRGVALSETDSDSFDLLSLFMGQLQRELRRASPGEAMLERLRLPLTQLAMRDQAFFTDAAHPARQLMDAISLAGAQWLAEDDLDAQWLGLLQRAASHVQQDAGGTPETFAEANQTLQSGLQALDRKAEMAERRQIEAARGREKLELARQRADQEIRRLLDGRNLPRFHATLLEQTWADVLSLTHLRSGEQSDAWRQLLEITAGIIDAGAGAAAQSADPGFPERIRAALEQVGYHTEDASAIAAQLAHGQGSDDDQASRTELLLQLRARARLGEDSTVATKTAAAPRTPEEQAAYERLRSLRPPLWVELDDDGQDGPQRRRLAWISEHTDQALLVNRRGLRAGNDNLDSLARKLAAGRLRLLEQHVAPATAAWDATLSSLQRIAPGEDAQATEPGHEP